MPPCRRAVRRLGKFGDETDAGTRNSPPLPPWQAGFPSALTAAAGRVLMDDTLFRKRRKTSWPSISKFRQRPRRSAKACAHGCRTSASRPRSGSRTRLQDSARRAAREGARAGPVVPVHPEGARRHGPRPARQRAGADGARRELSRRAVDEHAGPRRRDDADAARRTAPTIQKEKFLKPLLNGEKRICYSMTEKAAGADATGMQTRAEKKGNDDLRAERREVVLVGRQRRRHRAGDGQDRSRTRRATSSSRPSSSSCRTPATRSSATSRRWRVEGPLVAHPGRRPRRDRDQGPRSAGREPARRRGQRLQHGPAPPRLRPPAPRHAQRRDGAARARHGDGARHQALDLRQAAVTSARACSSCSPSARASSTSRG